MITSHGCDTSCYVFYGRHWRLKLTHMIRSMIYVLNFCSFFPIHTEILAYHLHWISQSVGVWLWLLRVNFCSAPSKMMPKKSKVNDVRSFFLIRVVCVLVSLSLRLISSLAEAKMNELRKPAAWEHRYHGKGGTAS